MLIPSRPIARRQLIRTAGAAFGLPFLEAMGPSLGKRTLASESIDDAPKRFVVMCAGLGFHAAHLFPTQSSPSKSAKLSPSTPYLKPLASNLDQVTLFSGLSHPEQQGNNGHASELTFLTSAQRPGLAGFRNTVSLDQLIARQIGLKTRFPYLALSTSGRSLSWTDNGVAIPGMSSPAKIFKQLFIDGNMDQVAQEVRQIKRGRSILDTVGSRAAAFRKKLGSRDQRKVDEYLGSVRDLEIRLQQSEGWVRRPKPVVDAKLPKDINDKLMAIERQRLMNDMVVLSLQTDSTRTVTLSLGGLNAAPKIPGVSSDWHGLSHHGKDPEKIAELKLIEQAEFTVFNEFLTKLRGIDEDGKSLLDNTAVLFGSNLGNASAHDWHNLPIILAGGGFRHGNYVAHDPDNNTPLANLFVSMAQRMGVETDTFGSSTAAGVRGLEQA